MAINLAPAQKKSKKSPRDWQFPVRFTQQEREVLDRLRGKLSYSAYVRQAALNRKVPTQVPDINREAYRLLLKVSANLNQLTRAVNTLSKQGKAIAGINPKVLEQLQQSVGQIRSDLIGASNDELLDTSDEVDEVEP